MQKKTKKIWETKMKKRNLSKIKVKYKASLKTKSKNTCVAKFNYY